MSRQIADLPHAVGDRNDLDRRLAGKRPAVFLDYDGTLTSIVDRPEDAIISSSMKEAIRTLATRCPVCVVSGRDRRVVQELMGLDNLVVAGSHGFDIWSPEGGAIERDEGAASKELMAEVEAPLREEMDGIEGAMVESKSVSVAAHYRLVSDSEKHKVKEIVDAVVADHPDELKLTPGKMVQEIQPNIDWDKGKAVLYLLEALKLEGDDVVPLYIGDDITDEDAFRALSGRGIGVFVGRADDPEVGSRTTSADYVLHTLEEVEEFLRELAATLARPSPSRG